MSNHRCPFRAAWDRPTMQHPLLDLKHGGAFDPIDHFVLEPGGNVDPVISGGERQLVDVANQHVPAGATRVFFFVKASTVEVRHEVAVLIKNPEGNLRVRDGPVQTEYEPGRLTGGQPVAARVVG